MTRLMLIRHGVTRWNKEGRYCGHKDIGLSSEGRSQVKLLFRKLNTTGFDKIYCSDRERAIQTARILFKKRKIIPDRRLREINFGILEGSRHEDIMGRAADIYGKWLKDPFKNKIPKAETMNDFKKRVEGAIKTIASSNSGKTVAIVCHGGVIGILLCGISKTRRFWRWIPSAASITTVEYKKGKPEIVKFNDTTHLLGVKDE